MSPLLTFAPMTNIPVPLSTHRYNMNVETSFCFLLSSIFSLFISTYFLFRIYERDRRRLCGAGGHEAGHTAGDAEGDRQGQARDH